MAILRIRDADGNMQEILAIKGDKGDKGADGTMTFEDLTDEQKASLKGEKGDSFTYSDFTPEQLASLKGEKGDKGDKGETGATGSQGIQGIQGIQGEKGEKGDNYILTPDDKTEIANQILSSKRVLPSVTNADNGKFLKVINGAWGAVAITDAEGVAY